ncbi:MAG: hypothetical protein HZA88_00720 [Verrucomicrobia bacterium]|nr:hypothetical protein [Verrucomicrobiota bacterium]
MRDRRLDRQIETLDDFLERWQKLGSYFQRAERGRAPTEIEEEEFLVLKGEMAQDYQFLMTGTGNQREPGDQTLEILGMIMSLRRLNALGEAEVHALEIAWHHTYMVLQGLLGRLKAHKLQLASVNVVGYYIGCVLRNPVVILLLMGGVVAAVLWLMNLTQTGSDKLIEPRGPRPTQMEKTSGL